MTDHHTEAERLLQESGDIPASDIAAKDIAAKDAEIERLREEVAMTERYRDDVIQACAAAEHERDIAACRLGGIGNALGLAAVDTADLPRLVRELRDERDKARDDLLIAQRLADTGTKALADLKADRDSWRNRADQNMGEAIEADAALADLKARLPGLVVLPENWREQVFDATDNAEVEDKWQAVTSMIESWRAEPAPREPEQAASPGPAHPDGTSEAHFQTRPRSAGESECTASREPEAPGFYIGDQVWHMPAGERGTVYATRDDARLCSVAFDSGQRRVWESDLRHVYDADHEPPQGVNVVRDMGVPADDDDGAYLCRTFDNKWRWEDGPTHDQFGAGGGSWALRIDDVDGPLVEHRPGDAA